MKQLPRPWGLSSPPRGGRVGGGPGTLGAGSTEGEAARTPPPCPHHGQPWLQGTHPTRSPLVWAPEQTRELEKHHLSPAALVLGKPMDSRA